MTTRPDAERRPIEVALTGAALSTLRLTPLHGVDDLDEPTESMILRALADDLSIGAAEHAATVGAWFTVSVDRRHDHLGVLGVFPAALDGDESVDWIEATFAWEMLLHHLDVGAHFEHLPRTNEAVEAALNPAVVIPAGVSTG